jgi:hypothetical protein
VRKRKTHRIRRVLPEPVVGVNAYALDDGNHTYTDSDDPNDLPVVGWSVYMRYSICGDHHGAFAFRDFETKEEALAYANVLSNRYNAEIRIY